MIYDVIIAGAGPCGSTLAKRIGADLKVLLLDKRSMEAEEHYSLKAEKCCGGLLDPSAQDALSTLKIGVPKHVLEDPQVFTVRAIDFDNHMERYYPKRYVNIDRTAFDRFLLERAQEEKDVEFWEESVLKEFTQSDGFIQAKVLHKPSGQVRRVTARYLVGADGAGSIVRAQLLKHYLIPVSGDALSGGPRKYVCIQEHYRIRPEEQISYHVAAFDRYVTDFYSWIIPKQDRLIVGSAIPEGKDARLKFAKLRSELIDAGFPLTDRIYQSGAKLLRPRPFGSVLTGRGRVFLCGEAAGLISPSSAEGISYALRSAVVLGEILTQEKKPSQKAYEKKLGRLKNEITLKSGKSWIMYNPLPRGAVFRTRLLSLDIKE